MCGDLDPWAAFNLKEHKNLTFFQSTYQAFFFSEDKIGTLSALSSCGSIGPLPELRAGANAQGWKSGTTPKLFSFKQPITH